MWRKFNFWMALWNTCTLQSSCQTCWQNGADTPTHPLELRFAYRICTKRTCHLEPVCQIPTMRKRRNLKYVNLKGVKYKIQYIGETKSMLCERFKEHRKAANNPLHASATSTVPPHFSLGLFTWGWRTPGRWGNSLRWGNPPVHIISHFNLITFTW